MSNDEMSYSSSEEKSDSEEEEEEIEEMANGETLGSRMANLLATGNGADVHFLVGKGDKKQQLSAHSPILSSASSVFSSMFSLAAGFTKRTRPVEVADVEVWAFKAMLKYIYIDNLDGLNCSTLFDVLFVAKKYKVNGLIKACENFPMSKINNIFNMYYEANSHGEKDFARRCLHYIDCNADALIGSKQFLQIGNVLLGELLDRVQLKINGEITIWKAALRWADEQCRKSGKECSADNRRAMLGTALYKIRLPLMPKEEFAKEIVPSGVLTPGEVISVLMFHAHPNRGMPDLYPLQFAIQRRTLSKHVDATVCPVLTLEIDKLSNFVRESNGRRISETVYIKGLPWMILATLITDPGTKDKYLSVYLICGEGNDSEWGCFCTATFKMVSQKEGKNDYSRKFSHFFHTNSADRCGIYNFMTIERLMNPRNNWYDKETDSALLEIDVDTRNGAETLNGTQKRRCSWNSFAVPELKKSQ